MNNKSEIVSLRAEIKRLEENALTRASSAAETYDLVCAENARLTVEIEALRRMMLSGTLLDRMTLRAEAAEQRASDLAAKLENTEANLKNWMRDCAKAERELSDSRRSHGVTLTVLSNNEKKVAAVDLINKALDRELGNLTHELAASMDQASSLAAEVAKLTKLTEMVGRRGEAKAEGRADGLFEANAVYHLKHPKSAIINGPAMSEVARRAWEIRNKVASLSEAGRTNG